jgi:hypothetical protein
MAHHGDDLSIANITVVGPDDHPTNVPFQSFPSGMFKNDASPDTFFSPSPEPELTHYGGYHDGDSSGGNVVPQPSSPTHLQRDNHSGYSTPVTPYSVPQYTDLHPLDTQGQGLNVNQDHAFDQALGGSPLNGSFSPSTLSPSFGGLTLSESAGDAQIFNSKDMSSYGFSPSLGIHDSNEFNVNNDGRGPLSLAIPGDIFPFDEPFDTTPSQSFDMNSLNTFISNDGLMPGASMQRPSRQMNHNRGLSVAGTSWTPAPSPSLTSPALSFTPSDYTSSGSLHPPTPFGHEDYSILGDSATVQRRHSSASHSRSPSRGRTSDPRMGGSSTSSSRRSSPYPSPRASCSPSDTLSPNQVWQQNDHLAVPMTSPTDPLDMGMGGANIPRRHSFNGSFSRGAAMDHGMHGHGLHAAPPRNSPNVLSFDEHQHISPASSSTSLNTSTRKVASNAGIKASEARRTKEARFKCDICSQTFTTNHNLKNHLNVHLGVKEHSCGSCRRDFTTQSVLARHMKTCKVANTAS